MTRFSGSGIFYPLTNPVTTLLAGYPHAFYAILCGFAGELCAVQVVGLLGGIAMAQRVSAPFLRKVIGALCIGLGAFLFLRQAGCF